METKGESRIRSLDDTTCKTIVNCTVTRLHETFGQDLVWEEIETVHGRVKLEDFKLFHVLFRFILQKRRNFESHSYLIPSDSNLLLE